MKDVKCLRCGISLYDIVQVVPGLFVRVECKRRICGSCEVEETMAFEALELDTESAIDAIEKESLSKGGE